MKTHELIEELQKMDPEGNFDVIINGEPIGIVDRQPAYYDGALQRINYEDGRIVSASYVFEGTKIVLIGYPISWVLLDNPDLPIYLEFNGRYPQLREQYEARIARERKEAKDINQEVEQSIERRKNVKSN